jgi:hypothetical protein
VRKVGAPLWQSAFLRANKYGINTSMPSDYAWARATISGRMLTVGDLAALLGVGRHQARRILLASGLPCRLITRHWRERRCGTPYTRKTWAVPVEVACLLRLLRTRQMLQRAGRQIGVEAPRALDEKISELEAQVECSNRFRQDI